MNTWFNRIEKLIYDEPFHYLAGPMSNLPSFNFPEFDRIAKNLRNTGLLISNPAEYEHERTREKIVASEDGAHHDLVGPTWAECLARDVCVVSYPTCEGVIVMEGWEKSRGALMETFVADRLGKPIQRYIDMDDGFDLVPVNRDAALLAQSLFRPLEDDAEDEAFRDLMNRNTIGGAR